VVQPALLKFDLKVKLAGLLVKLSLLFIFTDVLPSKHYLNLKLRAETQSEVIRKDFLTNLRHREGSGAFFTLHRREPGHLHALNKPSPQPVLPFPQTTSPAARYLARRERTRFVQRHVA